MGEPVDGPARAGPLRRRRHVRAQADEMAALLDAAAPRKRRASGRRAAAVPATAFAVLSLGGVSLVLGFAPTSAGAHLELPDAGAEPAPPASPAVVPTGSSGALGEQPAISDLSPGGVPDRADDDAARGGGSRGSPHRTATPARPAPGASQRADAPAAPTTVRSPRTTTSAPRPTTGRSRPSTTTATPTTRSGADDGATGTTDAGERSAEPAASPEGFAGRGEASGDGTDASSDPGGW